ncbi:MAG TPA: FxsA family protein [Actinomycetota bacterium]|nr:FxsA family protein [Actinomycetota bacterium]
MAPVLAVLLLVVPVVELAVIVQVAGEIGVLNTLGLLILVSVAGAWLLKQQGVAVWRSLQATMARGEMPTKEATDGALILLGGALLLTPGFVTDLVGLVFLIPPTRAFVKSGFRKLLGTWAAKRFGAAGKAGGAVYSARVTRVRRGGATDVTSSGSAGRLPAEGPPDDADGSPGTG